MKGSVGIKILVAILVILIVVSGILLGMKIMQDKDTQGKIQTGEQNEQAGGTTVVEMKEPKIFKGNDRPIAVMIDNHKGAMPQAGLNDAYLVYEIIVEGGETRLMALFKGVSLDKIGPVRSSRHYFLDYALENDAIYVHFGWSPQAQSDITKLGVNNINGISESSTSFWRTKDKYAPHNVATSTENILNIATRKGYSTTSKKESVLNYVADEFDLKDSAIEANNVTIPYSYSNTVEYEYDSTTKRYTRYSRDTKQVDWTTNETVTTKNIIIVKCANSTISGDTSGRQTIDNIKALKGYYITNGKAIEITAEKSTRESQTVYKDLQGNEIDVNDGNTFIQICPIDSNIKIEPGKAETTVTNEINE